MDLLSESKVFSQGVYFVQLNIGEGFKASVLVFGQDDFEFGNLGALLGPSVESRSDVCGTTLHGYCGVCIGNVKGEKSAFLLRAVEEKWGGGTHLSLAAPKHSNCSVNCGCFWRQNGMMLENMGFGGCGDPC